MTKVMHDDLTRWIAWAACCSIGIIGALLLGLSLSGPLVMRLAGADTGAKENLFPTDQEQLTRLLRIWAALLFLCVALICLVRRFGLYQRVLDSKLTMGFLWMMACSGVLFLLLTRLEFDAPWYKLEAAIDGSQTIEVFGRRLLLVWPARWIHVAFGVSPLRAYYSVQAVTIVATMAMIGCWSARAAGSGRAALAGQALSVFLLAPTFGYHTFYDIGIVFFHAAGLLVLWKRHYAVFVMIVAVGALNHENTVLLIVAAITTGILRRQAPVRIAGLAGATLAAWFVARMVMTVAVPMNASFHFRVITNLWELTHDPRDMAVSAAVLLPLALLTFYGWNAAPPFVRWSALVCVPLVGVTLLFGKFREPRQFDAYIPIAVAFGVNALKRPGRLEDTELQ